MALGEQFLRAMLMQQWRRASSSFRVARLSGAKTKMHDLHQYLGFSRADDDL